MVISDTMLCRLRSHFAELDAGLQNVILQPADITPHGLTSEGVIGEGDARIGSSPTTIGAVEQTEPRFS